MAPHAPTPGRARESRKVRILCVEDDPAMARLFQRRLSRAGYDVDLAFDGEEGLGRLTSDGYDVLCVDHQMPGITGLELIRILSERGNLPPTVMITGAGNEDISVEAMKLGASDYIIKDSGGRYLELISSVIEQALEKQKLLEEKRGTQLKIDRLIHDLRVHQTELEFQNEELRRAQEELWRMKERYQDLFDFAPVGYLTLGTGSKILEANFTAARLLRREKRFLVGFPLSFFVAPRDQSLFFSHFSEVFQRENGHTSEIHMARGDGTEIEVQLKTERHSQKGLGSDLCRTAMWDVTDRKRAERDLVRAKEEWERTFDAVPDLIMLLDNRHRIVRANRAMAKRLNRSPEDLKGARCFELVHGIEKPLACCPHTQTISTGSTHSIEVEASSLAGEFVVICSPLMDGQGSVVGSVHVARDITELKKAQQLFVQTERLQAIGELSAGVAHNFNNLLQVVMGAAQLATMDLEMGNLEDAMEQMDQILESARFGSATVARLQAFSRPRNGLEGGHDRIFDLAGTVQQAIEMSKVWWKSVAEREGKTIRLVRHLEQGCIVKGRENEMFEVAVNLIKNAVEALPEGGEIGIGVAVEDGTVLLRVQDNGAGIDETIKGRVFEFFFTTKGFRSTGMGLAGSYGIVTRHGGRLVLESRPGEGATFTAEIPLCAEPMPEETLDAVSFPPRLRILVIDDVPQVLAGLARALERHGQEVVTAPSGEEGIRLFLSQPSEIVVCDLGMPGLNGWEVGNRIRGICKETGLKKPFFVMLTGWGGQEAEQEKIRESGVDVVLEKPVDIRQVLRLAFASCEKSHS